MAARGLKYCERPINIGAKISFGLLNRWNDVGSRRKMENPFDTFARRINRPNIGNVSLDNIESRIALVLFQIATPADNKVVEDTNVTTFIDQTIDKMASDKACAPCHQINHSNLVDRPRERLTRLQPSGTPYQAP